MTDYSKNPNETLWGYRFSKALKGYDSWKDKTN